MVLVVAIAMVSKQPSSTINLLSLLSRYLNLQSNFLTSDLTS
eukprot:07848.XXX_147237_147362_1 [CDS] Oithona nana genome sequencing.